MSENLAKTIRRGTITLILANFIVKFIGIIYKIPLTNIIGGYGMSFFNSAFEIHQLLLAFSTAGLPVALSKMISESNTLGRYREVKKIFHITLITFTIVGFVGTAIMFLGASAFSKMIYSDLTKYSIMALAPSMFFFSITATFRGYFQGLQNMKPTAITQVIEAICKLFVGIGLAYLLLSWGKGPQYVSAGAIFGTTFSTLIATMLIIGIYYLPKHRNHFSPEELLIGECRSGKVILKDLMKIVIPITLGSLVVNLTGFLDLFLIMNRLGDTGMTQQAANTCHGIYKSYAQTLFNLPPSIITSINISIIPAVAAAFIKKDSQNLQNLIRKSLKIVILFAIPCGIGLTVLSGPILNLLYPARPDEVLIAIPLLRVLGIASIWVSVASLTTALLQAMGYVNLPLISLLTGGCIKLLTNYFLVGIPSIGIMGAPIGNNLCYLAILFMNIYFLIHKAGVKTKLWSSMVKPFLAALIMGLAALISYNLLEIFLYPNIATIIAILLSAIVYLLVLLAIKGINKDDILMLPGGRKLAAILKLK
ncbi:MAG: polysaccharide biosynthesis protein [Clostridiales bacterium]